MKILISGCSYTKNKEWPTHLFPSSDISNFAESASSNRYISDSIVHNIDLNDKPDFVFILWTGLNKLDIQLPDSKIIKDLAAQWKYFGHIGNSIYLFDGGNKYDSILENNYKHIKDDSWPDATNLIDFWNLDPIIKQECIDKQLFSFLKFDPDNLMNLIKTSMLLPRFYNNSKFFNDTSQSAIANCCTFLEYHNIPYKFTFVFDVFGEHTNNNRLQGKIDKTNSNFGRISWDKYVKLTPYEFGLKYDLLAEDQFHLTEDGMNRWAIELQRKL
jgi:hypothetical protein